MNRVIENFLFEFSRFVHRCYLWSASFVVHNFLSFEDNDRRWVQISHECSRDEQLLIRSCWNISMYLTQFKFDDQIEYRSIEKSLLWERLLSYVMKSNRQQKKTCVIIVQKEETYKCTVDHQRFILWKCQIKFQYWCVLSIGPINKRIDRIILWYWSWI